MSVEKKENKRGNQDEYTAESRSWEVDRVQRDRRAIKAAFIVAGIAVAVALAEALALVAMTPLKETKPYLVRVNNTTGVTDLVTAVDGIEHLDARGALNRYWIAKYVEAREGYFYPTMRRDYHTVALLSVGGADTSYVNYMNPEQNRNSPITRYGDRLQVDVNIRSISFLDQGVASVRFTKTSKIENEPARTSEWIATVEFDYRPSAKLGQQDRRINPLGFFVTRYRVDAESGGNNAATNN